MMKPRVLVYSKHTKDAPIFEKYRTQSNLIRFPVMVVEKNVCRDELLFEIEVDAIRTEQQILYGLFSKARFLLVGFAVL